MAVQHVSMNNFKQEVLQSDKPVLLDFYASWCGPCRMLAPILDEIAEEHPEIKVVKINVDEEQELASQYQVISIPSLFVLENGQVINQALGVKPKQQILDMLL